MGQRLARLFDLRPGEARPAIGAFLALFGLIAGHTILETARDALFLSKLPPTRLTLVYVLLAASALVVSAWNASFVRRFGRRNALIVTLVVAAYGTTLLHFLPHTEAALFGLYTWSALIGTVLGVQFWMFAGQLFTVAQGKRLFGPIAAGGVGGAVVGASGAAAALMVIPVGSLLLVSAGLFLATAMFVTTLAEAAPADAPESRAGASDADLATPDPAPIGMLALFRQYPYLRQMAVLAVISTAALLVADYLFKSIASQTVPRAELGSFFARTYAVLNALSLLVQLFITGRVLRGVGVVPALAIVPFLLAGGAAGVFLSGGSLLMALFMKGADGSLRYSLHRVASELLWMPLPGAVRDRSKALLDSVFGRATQAVVAGLLLLLAMLGLGTPRVLAATVIALSAAWLATNVMMRGSYLDLFRKALSRGTLEVPIGAEELDLSSVEAVMDALSSREADHVIAALELLREKKRSRLIPGLILYHEAESVLVCALDIAAETERKEWVPLILRLLTHPSEAVRVAAVRALSGARELESVLPALADASPAVRAHAAFCVALADESKNPSDHEKIRELMAQQGEAGRAARNSLVDAIRDRGDERWADVLLSLFESCGDEVASRAVTAMTRVRDPRFIPLLIARLGIRDGRSSVREALVHQGERALEALIAALYDVAIDPALRAHLPRTIARFEVQRAADVLTRLIEKERSGFVRYKALRGLGRLVAHSTVRVDRARIEQEIQKNLLEHLRVLALAAPIERQFGRGLAPGEAPGARIEASASIVIGLLADKLRQSLERAFRLLQIVHPREDIRTAHEALLSADKRKRAQASEFLDTLTLVPNRRRRREGTEIRELLRVIADDLPPAERVARARRFVASAPATLEDAVSMLLGDRDDLVATFGAYLALDLGGERLRGEVDALCVARPTLEITSSIDRRSFQPPKPVLAEVAHGG